jgi:uncharacterized membrane protein
LSDRALRIAAVFVALAGIAVAGYLTWAHYADRSVICVQGGGCEEVQESSYAEIAGIPVAVLGLAFYVSTLALLAWDDPIARISAATLALVGLLFSAYLVVVQVFVIDAVCLWCMASDLVLVPALAVLTAMRIRS